MAGSSDTTRTMKRRAILAAAAAVVAGIAARRASVPQPVAADGATWTVPYNSGNQNIPTSLFALTNAGASAINVTSGGYYAVVGTSSVYHGLGGYSSASGAVAGVYGEAFSGSYGVYGKSNNVGVQGQGAIGVFGTASGSGGTGTYGYATGGGGTGVTGYATAGTGVYGVTNASYQYGVLGLTTAPNSTAIAGVANQAGCSAFSGGTTNPNAYAGVFQGNVVIQGRLVVSDPSYKSGALAHPDGSHRLVYCIESPESWIEDVGKGQLVGGKATVTFEKDFAAVTHTDDYRVFLTAHGDSQGLYVTNETPSGFEVREQQGGASTLEFSWRVMVKGKSGVKHERLGTFPMPNPPLPDVSTMPQPPAPTFPPAERPTKGR